MRCERGGIGCYLPFIVDIAGIVRFYRTGDENPPGGRYYGLRQETAYGRRYEEAEFRYSRTQ